MKALSVHGGGAVSASTSCNVGRLGQYGPAGIARLNGLEGRKSPEDMNPCSSSASQSERTDEHLGETSRMGFCKYNDGGFRCFDLRIALRRYFMSTQRLRFTLLPTVRVCIPFLSSDSAYSSVAACLSSVVFAEQRSRYHEESICPCEEPEDRRIKSSSRLP